MPSIRSRLLFLVLLVGFGVLIERLIVTDEEAIRALTEEAAEAANARDLGRLESVLSSSFKYGPRDRQETVARVGSLLNRYRPLNIGITLFDVRIEDGQATATAVVAAQVLGRPVRQRVELEFEEGDDGWVLLAAKGGSWPR